MDLNEELHFKNRKFFYANKKITTNFINIIISINLPARSALSRDTLLIHHLSFNPLLNLWFFLKNGLLVISLQVTYHRGLILIQSHPCTKYSTCCSGSVNAYLPVLSHPYPPVSRTVAQVGALPKRIARRYRHFLAVRPVQHLVRRSRRRLAGERTYYRGDVRRDSVWPVGRHHYRRDCGYSPVFN